MLIKCFIALILSAQASPAVSARLLLRIKEGEHAMTASVHISGSRNRIVTNKCDLFPLSGENGLFRWYEDNFTEQYSSTQRQKRGDLRRFEASLCRQLKCKAFELTAGDVTFATVEGFVTECLEVENYQPSYVNRMLSTLRQVFKQFCKRHPEFPNPMERVSPVPMPEPEYKGIDPDIADSLVDAAFKTGRNPFLQARNGTMVLVMLATGLRSFEITLIRMNQISSDFRFLKNVLCKYRKIKNKALPEEVAEAVKVWTQVRERGLIEKKSGYRMLNEHEKGVLPLFPAMQKSKLSEPDSFFLTYNGFYQQVSKVAKTADKGHYNPHRYRHAFARNLLDDCKDIRLVAQALGHTDTKTTMIYTERELEDLHAASSRAWKRRSA